MYTKSRNHPRLVGALVALVVLAAPVLSVDHVAAASGTTPLPVTPYSGFNSILTRAPYVTDLTQTSADVNWATTNSTTSVPGSIQFAPVTSGSCPASVGTWSSTRAIKVASKLPAPVLGGSTVSGSSSLTASEFTLTTGGTSTKEYQATVGLGLSPMASLSPSTTYCYAVFSTDTSSAAPLLPSSPGYQTFTTLDPVSTSSTTPLTFDVTADTGENYEYTSSTASKDVPYPNNINPDQASIYHQIGMSAQQATNPARFLMIAGDIAYSGGNQITYGDLDLTGTQPEVSNIFGPSYFPQTGGIPTYAADGNHGQNATTLTVWPTETTAAASGGTYDYDAYDSNGIDGSFPDDWYAFSTGNVRMYVIDGAWSDGSSGPSGTGNATGSLCSTPAYCEGYQADYSEHWETTSPEYQWLQKDLQAHPGGVKFAVFHYPLRSVNATQPSDPYVENSSVNPSASTSLEALLAANGVDIAFNGHAHTYQRVIPNDYGKTGYPQSGGQIINYVTGGGGGVLEPVTGGSCTSLQTTASVYALGWGPSTDPSDPTGGHGSACGPSVPTPTAAAQVYNYLQVTVKGNTVTVTPYNAAGGTFDVQSYTFNSTTTPGTPSAPSNVTATAESSSAVQLDWTASSETGGSITSYQIARNGQALTTVSGTATAYTDTTVQPSTEYTYSVTAVDANNVDSSPGVSNQVTTPAANTGGPQLVQTVPATESTAATSLTASVPNGTSAGDLLVLSASEYAGSTNPISVTDSAGNKWTKVPAALNNTAGHNSDGEMWYAADASPVTSVTVTTKTATFVAFEVQEYSGMATSAPLDISAGTSTTGTQASSGTAAPSAAGDLAVGFVAGHGNAQPITVTSSGYTVQPQLMTTGSVASVVTGYQVLTGTPAQSFAGTFSTAMYWAAGIALFKVGAGGPPADAFTLSASPSSGSVAPGSTATSTIATTITGGSAESVTLSASGAPSGTSVAFSPQPINSGQSSTMSITTSASTLPGTYSITVTGTGTSTASSTYSLTVTGSASSTPALVQTAGGTETAAATTLTATFPSASTTGDLLVLSASEDEGATNHITKVTDSAGNVWSRVGAYDVSGHSSDGELWYVANAASATTVTVQMASAASVAFEVQEFSGVATANALDTSAGAANTGTSANSGNATSTQVGELAVGFIAGHGSKQAVTFGAPGYTAQPQQTSAGTSSSTEASVVTGYRVLGAAGAQAVAGSFATAMYWASGVVIFEPSA